ncbi:MAG: hypothetical protein V7771_05910 [Shewanella psychromarinicola]|jgi:hypothetical protein|uniref:hypothetical protein n=1 Tax=Shewanella TaxID=22 RepID=UPI0012FEE8EB|nr:MULTISPECIES: hypothetical protein [Shewanella]MCL1083957.1 hypothetical protein [Shewanella psychromarinicola]
MKKINLSRQIKSVSIMLNNIVQQCRQNIFFLAHLGCSQWDDVETRSGKHK